MRTFIAVNFPDEVKEHLGDIIETLRSVEPHAKWVRPENIHVTLKFIGEIGERRVGALADRVASVTDATRSATISLSGFGVFPKPDRARVFWVAIATGGPWLGSLARQIDVAMGKLGFPHEKRRFSAHVTLARFRNPLPVNALVSRAEVLGYESAPIAVSTVDVMKSVLAPGGPTYTILERCPLGRG